MIYTTRNSGYKCAVFDVDRNERLMMVVAINTAAAWIEVIHDPRQHPDEVPSCKPDEVPTFRLYFDSIYAIWGKEPLPVLFHCYGRRKQPAVTPQAMWLLGALVKTVESLPESVFDTFVERHIVDDAKVALAWASSHQIRAARSSAR